MNRVGETKSNNFGSIMEIIAYRGYTDIDIYFPEYNWTYKHAAYNAFKNGRVKCPYEPRLYGIAYLGEGVYKSHENRIQTDAYSCWCRMLYRCYISDRQSYKGCYVCNEWLNFQNFAEWYVNNYYTINNETMCLDKDILYKGNKVYSPDTCIFVPNKINMLFVKCNGLRGEYPIGVYKTDNKYTANYNIDGCTVYLGRYDTPEEAFYAYKEDKEKHIKEVADEYKEFIPYILYEAMYNYEVEITD